MADNTDTTNTLQPGLPWDDAYQHRLGRLTLQEAGLGPVPLNTPMDWEPDARQTWSGTSSKPQAWENTGCTSWPPAERTPKDPGGGIFRSASLKGCGWKAFHHSQSQPYGCRQKSQLKGERRSGGIS